MKNVFVRTISFLWILILPLFALAQAAQPTPMPGTFVHDFAGVISNEKKAEIQAQAQKLKDEYKTEIAVVTIDSLQGEESFDYSMRMARSWGIGSQDNDIRGLLILVAVKDRKTAFRTSRHIEGELPDGITGEISRRMNVSFKNGDFGGGLSSGVSLIIDRLSGVYEPQTLTNQPAEIAPMPQWFFTIIAVSLVIAAGLLFLVFYMAIKDRRLANKEKRAWIAAGQGRT
ncbi:MAG: TPM domain-containing protein, partial [Pyrinomonadaceae bacterium]